MDDGEHNDGLHECEILHRGERFPGPGIQGPQHYALDGLVSSASYTSPRAEPKQDLPSSYVQNGNLRRRQAHNTEGNFERETSEPQHNTRHESI